jgi:hypothetical protein
MASPSQPVRTRNGWGLPAVDKQTCCIAFKIADREQVHPLRIQKGTPSTSPIKTASSIPRPLSELAPTEKRRNSPSFNQVTKVGTYIAPLGGLKANFDLTRRWFPMGTRLHSSLLPSTLPMAIRHRDSSGKAVIPRLPIDSTQRICSVQESPLLPPRDDRRSKNFNVRRVSRTATCSRANKSKNTTQHQYP